MEHKLRKALFLMSEQPAVAHSGEMMSTRPKLGLLKLLCSEYLGIPVSVMIVSAIEQTYLLNT